jgi:hypothetical protein
MLDLDKAICPGCNKEIPLDNNGCPFCGFEVDSNLSEDAPFRIPSLYWWMLENTFELNQVCADFIKMLLLEVVTGNLYRSGKAVCPTSGAGDLASSPENQGVLVNPPSA